MRRFIYILLGILLLGTVAYLLFPKQVAAVLQPSARAAYEMRFNKGDSLLLQWNIALEKAIKDSILITLPYTETGIFKGDSFQVHSYMFQLKEGEQVVVSVEKEIDSALVFLELFQKENDSLSVYKKVESDKEMTGTLVYKSSQYTFYKLAIQPEIETTHSYRLKIYTQPSYGFPVAGASNKNVQSFWGAPRGGGKRSHEGVDIFADKGTPVVAISDGRITSTANKGLGGKQVWMRDKLIGGKSFYYAHLDSIAVTRGASVKTGDTLGWVGNTGNAETTAPHLHFGIYKGSTGAVNPYPFIKQLEIPEITYENTVTAALVLQNRTAIYQGATSGLPQLASLSKNDTVQVLGRHHNWYHVVANDSIKGYISKSKVQDIVDER